MAVIRDVMPAFELFQPATVDGRPERTWSRIDYEWKIE